MSGFMGAVRKVGAVAAVRLRAGLVPGRGLTLVEYVLGAAFVAVIATLLGPQLIDIAGNAIEQVSNAFNQSSGGN